MDMADVIGDHVRVVAQHGAQTYRQGARRPLGGYVLVMALFGALAAVADGLAKAKGRTVPQLGPSGLLAMTLGTPTLSRARTKDAVTGLLRAPFTQYEFSGGPAAQQAQS